MLNIIQTRQLKGSPKDTSIPCTESAAEKAITPNKVKYHNWLWSFAGFGLVLLAFHGVLSTRIAAAGDWEYLGSRASLEGMFPFPSLWSYGNLGSGNIFGAPTYVLWSLVGLLAHFGAGYGLAERLVWLLPILFISYFATVLFLRYLNVSIKIAALLATAYTINTFTIDWFSGGWYTFLLGYALMPLIALALAKFLDNANARWMVISGLLIGMLGWTDLREVSIVGITIVVIFLVSLAQPQSRQYLFRHITPKVLGIPAIALLLQAHWLLPYLSGQAAPPANVTSVHQLYTFSFMSLQNTMGVFDIWWPHLKYFVQFTTLPAIWLIFPFIIVLGFIRNRQDPIFQVFVAVYLFISALATGTNGPFAGINAFLYVHIPSLDLFRYPAIYEQTVILALVICSGRIFGQQQTNLPGSATPKRLTANYKSFGSLLTTVSVIFIFFVTIVSAFPAISNHLAGNLRPVVNASNAQAIETKLSLMPSGSVLWIPGVPRLANQDVVTYKGLIHPNISGSTLSQAIDGTNTVYQGGAYTWESSAGAIRQLYKYDIGYIVLDSAIQPYSDQGIGGYRSSILSWTRALQLEPIDHSGSLTLYLVNPNPLIQAFTYAGGTANDHSTSPITLNLNLEDHSQVFNSDNFRNSSSLELAGISASNTHCGSAQCLLLRARTGEAKITYPLKPMRLSNNNYHDYTISVNYRTSQGANLIVQTGSTVKVNLVSTNQDWNIHQQTLLISNQPSTLDLMLLPPSSIYPKTRATSVWAEIRSITLTASGHSPGAGRSVISSVTKPFTSIAATRPGAFEPSDISYRTVGKNSFLINPDRSNGQPQELVVFWQSFDPSWRASVVGSHKFVQHVLVNGWANGFLVDTNGGQHLIMRYDLQSALDSGLTITDLSVVLGFLYLIWEFLKLRLSRLRGNGS